MSFVFAGIAVLATVLNWKQFLAGKRFSFFLGIALLFTALFLCTEYQQVAGWTAANDLGAIQDVAPTMSHYLWVIACASGVLNLIPALLEKHVTE